MTGGGGGNSVESWSTKNLKECDRARNTWHSQVALKVLVTSEKSILLVTMLKDLSGQ